MWDEPKEPIARAAARIAADDEYRRLAIEEIRADPIHHFAGRLTRGVGLLWITEIPIRYSDINRLPTVVIRGIWFAQALLMVAAAAGLFALWRRGHQSEAAALAACFVYLTAVHVVLYSEARYSLPARPAILVLAVLGVQATALSVTDRGQKGARGTTQALGSGRPLG